LAPALAGGLLLVSCPVAQAVPTGPIHAAARQTFSAGTYLVQLDDKPVATGSKPRPPRANG
jgi:hypothetical protein